MMGVVLGEDAVMSGLQRAGWILAEAKLPVELQAGAVHREHGENQLRQAVSFHQFIEHLNNMPVITKCLDINFAVLSLFQSTQSVLT